MVDRRAQVESLMALFSAGIASRLHPMTAVLAADVARVLEGAPISASSFLT